MKTGQNKNNVKFTKTLIAENIKKLMEEKNLSVIDLAEKALVSRQAIYNIFNGAIPRDDTLELIAKELDTTVETLKYGERHFDYDYFCQKLYEIFPYHIKEEDYQAYTEGLKYDDPDSLDLESFLIYKFDLDPFATFISHILPTSEKQKEIAKYFGYKVEDIFKSYGSFPLYSNIQNIKHINVMSKEEFATNKFNSIFEKLNIQNKKLVLNLCLDLLQIQNN